jgi:acetylornithine deacetylase/succinyl-diaminopimelate desuccinylase-like protein
MTGEALWERPAELLQRLIRFETVNPPGDEAECIGWIEGLLSEAGFETKTVERDAGRPNLITRLEGEGAAPPLLLYGHVDVVTAAGQDWTHPPFAAEEVDGMVWGRGTLDMKGGVAMFLAALLRARAEDLRPAGDVILAVLCDEEAGGGAGARFLVSEHPELFDGVRYALGEWGGFSIEVAGRRFYPIQVAEKQKCPMSLTVTGPGGHGSVPMRGGAMARLSRVLRRLDRGRLPVHVTDVPRQTIEAVADGLPSLTGAPLRALLRPTLTDRVLDLLGERAELFDPMLHNTVNATVVRAGDKDNVVPSEASVHLDGRLLPGFGSADAEREVRALVGDDVEIEVERHDPYPVEPDMGLFDTLAGILREADSGGRAIPLLMPGITDGRHLAPLGIQTYGFIPMRLPADLRPTKLIHAADERVPVDGVAFGADAVYRVLERFGDRAA